ncbi:hypothetical protein FACS189459_2130 [Bacilli bacterium]|nr:hypothetical protein FACS189459_2130 [Bacilli bacterium]
MIVPCVLAIITILGVVLLFTIGVHGSYAFYDGTIIRVDIAKYNVLKDSINNITK